MSNDNEDFMQLTKCTCLQKNDELEVEELVDADFHDPECPIHGGALSIKE